MVLLVLFGDMTEWNYGDIGYDVDTLGYVRQTIGLGLI